MRLALKVLNVIRLNSKGKGTSQQKILNYLGFLLKRNDDRGAFPQFPSVMAALMEIPEKELNISSNVSL